MYSSFSEAAQYVHIMWFIVSTVYAVALKQSSIFFCTRDLAVDLRMKLGDWFRVVQLLKTGDLQCNSDALAT